MIHDNPEHLQYHHPEAVEARAAAVRNLGFAAMMLTSVNEIHSSELTTGCLSDETREAANVAGQRYNDAIRGLLVANESFKHI